MKKTLLTLAVIAIVKFSYAQWTGTTNIYNTNSGNVGIGTASIPSKVAIGGGDLQVENGQGRFKGWYNAGSGRALEVGISSGIGYIYNYDRTAGTEGDLTIGGATSASGGITVKVNTGNVGIGTTSPVINGGGLEISRTGQAALRVSNSTAGTHAEFGTDGAGGFVQTLESGDNFRVYTGAAAGPQLIVLPSGNIGIGTTSPAEKLHIIGNVRADGAYPYFNLYNTSWTSNSYIQSGVDQIGVGAGNYLSFLNPASKGFAFSEGSTNVMTIGTTGNVGIGTTSPLSALDVNGQILARPTNNNAFAINNSGSDYGFISTGAIDTWSLGHGPTLNSLGTSVLTWTKAGNVGIGTTIPDTKLAVLGTIHANEVKVDLSVPGPDYVFKPDYKLTDLSELKTYVDKNHHLPEIPSSEKMAKDGLNLGEMNTKLLKKVEELTLYLIEQNKQLTNQQKKFKQQDEKIEALENALSKLTNNAAKSTVNKYR